MKKFESIAGFELDEVYEMYTTHSIPNAWVESLSKRDRERLDDCISLWDGEWMGADGDDLLDGGFVCQWMPRR